VKIFRNSASKNIAFLRIALEVVVMIGVPMGEWIYPWGTLKPDGFFDKKDAVAYFPSGYSALPLNDRLFLERYMVLRALCATGLHDRKKCAIGFRIVFDGGTLPAGIGVILLGILSDVTPVSIAWPNNKGPYDVFEIFYSNWPILWKTQQNEGGITICSIGDFCRTSTWLLLVQITSQTRVRIHRDVFQKLDAISQTFKILAELPTPASSDDRERYHVLSSYFDTLRTAGYQVKGEYVFFESLSLPAPLQRLPLTFRDEQVPATTIIVPYIICDSGAKKASTDRGHTTSDVKIYFRIGAFARLRIGTQEVNALAADLLLSFLSSQDKSITVYSVLPNPTDISSANLSIIRCTIRIILEAIRSNSISGGCRAISPSLRETITGIGHPFTGDELIVNLDTFTVAPRTDPWRVDLSGGVVFIHKCGSFGPSSMLHLEQILEETLADAPVGVQISPVVYCTLKEIYAVCEIYESLRDTGVFDRSWVFPKTKAFFGAMCVLAPCSRGGHYYYDIRGFVGMQMHPEFDIFSFSFPGPCPFPPLFYDFSCEVYISNLRFYGLLSYTVKINPSGYRENEINVPLPEIEYSIKPSPGPGTALLEVRRLFCKDQIGKLCSWLQFQPDVERWWETSKETQMTYGFSDRVRLIVKFPIITKIRIDE
jgi:hypothetical protein